MIIGCTEVGEVCACGALAYVVLTGACKVCFGVRVLVLCILALLLLLAYLT
jgi:hypothetical protein